MFIEFIRYVKYIVGKNINVEIKRVFLKLYFELINFYSIYFIVWEKSNIVVVIVICCVEIFRLFFVNMVWNLKGILFSVLINRIERR